ncbi:hypothetical protein LguiA_035358 [Lonicera macranthoides]
MLLKFFGARMRKPHAPSKPSPTGAPVEERSSALKIIHAGGKVEYYYMAVPAARIMEKYPSFSLARPDIFRRPWDSVVRPEEILIPGQKYFIVPNRTVRKLKRRIGKPRASGENLMTTTTNSFVLESFTEIVSQENDGFSSNSFSTEKSCTSSLSSGTKAKVKTKARVRFIGIDSKHDSGSGPLEKKRSTEVDVKDKKAKVTRPGERKRRVRSSMTWQPSLTVIDESHGSDE